MIQGGAATAHGIDARLTAAPNAASYYATAFKKFDRMLVAKQVSVLIPKLDFNFHVVSVSQLECRYRHQRLDSAGGEDLPQFDLGTNSRFSGARATSLDRG